MNSCDWEVFKFECICVFNQFKRLYSFNVRSPDTCYSEPIGFPWNKNTREFFSKPICVHVYHGTLLCSPFFYILIIVLFLLNLSDLSLISEARRMGFALSRNPLWRNPSASLLLRIHKEQRLDLFDHRKHLIIFNLNPKYFYPEPCRRRKIIARIVNAISPFASYFQFWNIYWIQKK